MDRRDAMKALASVVAGSGVSVTPAHDAEHCELIVIRVPAHVSNDVTDRLKVFWEQGMEGTAFEKVKTVILTGGIDVEFVRR